MRQAVWAFNPEPLQGHIPGRRSEGKETDVGLRSPRLLVLRDHLLDIVARCRLAR